MFQINEIKIDNALLLAPMEDVTDIGYRKLCKELGADIVYTEFVNSDGLIRNNKKTHTKLRITEEERPVGIQIYGGDLNAMVDAARIAEAENPDIIDINAGCWVKKIAKRGAGAGLLLDPPHLQKMVEEIVKSVDKPVTVKTRIGWDEENLKIIEVAQRLEDVGIKALTVHCRTRSQGHSGDAIWDWIPRVKEVVNIPVVLNGGVFTAEDAVRAFREYNADAVMIARGAIDHPWIFREAKYLLETGRLHDEVTYKERIFTALRHLKYQIEIKDSERHAVIPFRKYYSGYLKGLHKAKFVRQELMKYEEYAPVEEVLLNYLEELTHYNQLDQDTNKSLENS